MEISEAIVKRINNLSRKKKIKSNYELAKLSGIDKSTLNYFLSRKTKTIRIENLLHICEALDITLTEFFDDPLFFEVEAND